MPDAKTMGPRRKAREYALQMLFQWDITHDAIDEIAATFFENQAEDSEAVSDFARQLVKGTVEHVEQIDEMIRRHAEHWRLDRMATVDRNLLRLAVQEFLYEKETPKTVVINEAIEIARRFSALESPQFINGVLDSIKKELEL
jgi:transcription antitermination protein NusB